MIEAVFPQAHEIEMRVYVWVLVSAMAIYNYIGTCSVLYVPRYLILTWKRRSREVITFE